MQICGSMVFHLPLWGPYNPKIIFEMAPSHKLVKLSANTAICWEQNKIDFQIFLNKKNVQPLYFRQIDQWLSISVSVSVSLLGTPRLIVSPQKSSFSCIFIPIKYLWNDLQDFFCVTKKIKQMWVSLGKLFLVISGRWWCVAEVVMTENHQQNGLSVLIGGWRASAGVAGLVSSKGCEKRCSKSLSLACR